MFAEPPEPSDPSSEPQEDAASEDLLESEPEALLIVNSESEPEMAPVPEEPPREKTSPPPPATPPPPTGASEKHLWRSSGSHAAHDWSQPSLAATRKFARSKILVRVKNLHKAFGEKKILRGVSFVVHEGETLCIVGGSGTGKSVTLKHVMRLLSPDEGEIWLDGEDITHARGDSLQLARQKLGVNFQFGALLNWLTVFENAALPLRENTTMTDEQIEERVMSKLELLKIPHARDPSPPEISGGMRKRAGLARAVVMEETVKVILYDEPTSGLDPISTALVDEMINEMRQRLGLAQIVITHDMASVRRTADSVVVLHEGKIVQYGTPDEIEASSVPYVQQFVSGLTALPQEAKP